MGLFGRSPLRLPPERFRLWRRSVFYLVPPPPPTTRPTPPEITLLPTPQGVDPRNRRAFSRRSEVIRFLLSPTHMRLLPSKERRPDTESPIGLPACRFRVFAFRQLVRDSLHR